MATKKTKSSELVQSAVLPEDNSPHELEFTATMAAWMTGTIERNPEFPFSAAKCEKRSKGSQKRRDLTLLGKEGQVLVTGEVKLPYQKDGASPYNAAVVRDARQKAEQAGARYFFTWNVNECVLWETQTSTDDPASSQNYQSWKVTTVTKGSHLRLPSVESDIDRWMGKFLYELSHIILGQYKVGVKAPDERFIDALEAALNLPIRLTWEALEKRYESISGKFELDAWMRDEQGWTITDDLEGIRDNLERAAKFTCYALVNKLIFYEALMKRYGTLLHKLAAPEHIDTADGLQMHFESFFADAKKVTGDYETVFGEDQSSVGTRIPFYADFAVPYWRQLINQIHDFDFSKLDYEVIGSIFERLIGPEERHKYGQFYTRAEVVDLINSFCIRTGEESVFDPACGGGTFLVRAYARKRTLAPGRRHEQMLEEIYGVDISPFACHLTTINLATRDLIQDENYPRIARADFFDVQFQRSFIFLPTHIKAKGLGKIQHRDIQIPMLDAVIGNPPYVRQEAIKSNKIKGNGYSPGTKEFYRKMAMDQAGAKLSGRSDLHCYFWPHAMQFLKPEGWLCLLTSSQWLDVEYGFRLQDWMISRFKIVAIFESVEEPWFVGARVATVATILQRCDDPDERIDNLVRFVQLRRPVAELLAHDGTTAGSIYAADKFRDEILSLTGNTSNYRYRTRLVPQRQLLEDGIRLGRLMRGQSADEDEETGNGLETVNGDYYGGKWGLHLRAPDLWFDLIERFGNRMVPLGELAEIHRGVTTGKDEFFYPRDASLDCLAEITEPVAFQHEYGVKRELVESGEVLLVRCGEKYGEIRPIEAKYLEPEVHSLMEVKGYSVSAKDCARMILLVDEQKTNLQGTFVLKYIEGGEARGWHQGTTCAARATDNRQWYDLAGHRRGALFWPKAQQYKHAAPSNDMVLLANCNLYDITPFFGINSSVLAGILNSSVVVLAKYQFGRPVGNEGNLKTEVVDVNMMLVPDPRHAPKKSLQRISNAFIALKKRDAMQLLPEQRMRRMAYEKTGRKKELAKLSDRCELDMADRRELDDAVLEMLGCEDRKERKKFLDLLYQYLRGFFEHVRQKEEKAIVNKNRSKRKTVASPTEIAIQVLSELKDKHGYRLRNYADFVNSDKPFDTYKLPELGVAELHNDIFAAQGSVRFIRGRKTIGLISTKTLEQADLVARIANHGIRDYVRVPRDPQECEDLKRRFESHMEDRYQRIRLLIAERTGDPELQEAIFAAVNDLIKSGEK